MPTMKRSLLLLTFLAAGAASLSSCGGGGKNEDESGSPTTFSVVPAAITVTGTPLVGVPTGTLGVCGAGSAGEVFIYGGVPPYRIDNTSTDTLAVSTNTVDHKGGSFTVTVLAGGACPLDPGLIGVVDSLDHQLT